jgi:ribosomal protein S18 acetylase RimI-like enzyme
MSKLNNFVLENKKVLGIFVLIMVLVGLYFLFQFNSVSSEVQTFSYSNLIVTKTISFDAQVRTEIYLIDLNDPVVGYIIIPKTIADDVSQIRTSGDFKTSVIQADPILFIEPKDLFSGEKTFKLKLPVGAKDQSTMLLLIPLAEYNEFNEIQKQGFETSIKNLSNLDVNYFSISESKKIMEEFASGPVSAELKKKVNKKQIFFAENNSNQYLSLIQSIIDDRNTLIQTVLGQVTPVNENSNYFNSLQSQIQNILGSRQTSTEINPQPESNYTMTINFKSEEEKIQFPNEFVMQYSTKTPVIMWNGIIELETETDLAVETKLIFNGPNNFDFNYIQLFEDKSKKNISKYLVTIKINAQNYFDQSEAEEIISFNQDRVFANKKSIKITLINNPCNEFPQYYQNTINTIDANYKKDLARIQAVSCIGDKTPQDLAIFLENYTFVALNDANTISESKIVGSLNYYPQLYSELNQIKEETKRQKYLDYGVANNGLITFVNTYNSYLDNSQSKLNELKKNTTNQDVVELADFFYKKFELLKSETKLWLDPTKPENITEVVNNKLAFLATIDPELLMASTKWVEEKEKLEKNYKSEYGDWKIKTFPTLRAIYLSEVNSDLNDLTREFAKLFLYRGIGFDALDTDYYTKRAYSDISSIFMPNSSTQNLQSSKLLREITELLVTKDFSDKNNAGKLYTAINGFRSEIGLMKVTSEETIYNFEYPSSNTWETFLDNLGVGLNSLEFQVRRDGLREEIEQKTKEKVGLILISQRIYDSSFTGVYKGKKLTNSGITKYDQINFKLGKNSLLEVYEVISKEQKDRNSISSWMDNPTEEKIDLAIQSLEAAFEGPFSHEIEIIKHMKFRSFINNDISKAEEFEAELALIQNVIDNEDLLITRAITEAQEEVGENEERKFENLWGFNDIIFNAYKTGLWVHAGRSTENLQEKFDSVKGLTKIKEQLSFGKTILETYLQNEQILIDKKNTKPKLEVNTIHVNYGGEHGQINNTFSNQSEIDNWEENFKKMDESKIKIAFANHILKTEIEKQQLIKKNSIAYASILNDKTLAEKRELILPKEIEANFVIKIANYYKSEKLYDFALENYFTIMNEFPNTAAAKLAEQEARSITFTKKDLIPFVTFFKKRSRENVTLMVKEFTSLKSIAAFATTYAFVKVIAVPRLLNMKGAQTAIQNQAARKIMVQELFKETATSPQGMKLAMENINLNLIGVPSELGGMPSLKQAFLNLTKARRIKDIWAQTKFVAKLTNKSIKDTKTYQLLTKDLLSTSAKQEKIKELFMRGYTKQVKSELEAYANAKGVVNGRALNLTDTQYANKLKGFAKVLFDDKIITQKGFDSLISQADDFITEAQKASDVLNSLSIQTTDTSALTFSNVSETYALRQMANIGTVDLARTSSESGVIFGGDIAGEVSALTSFSESIISQRVTTFAKLEKANISVDKVIVEQQIKNYHELQIDNPYLLTVLEDKLARLEFEEILNTPVAANEISIECSVCKFKDVDGEEINLVVGVDNTLKISNATIGGQPIQQLKITQIIDPSFQLANVSPPSIIGENIIKITITTPTHVDVITNIPVIEQSSAGVVGQSNIIEPNNISSIVFDTMAGQTWVESFSNLVEKQIAEAIIQNIKLNTAAEFEQATKIAAQEISRTVADDPFAILFDFDKGKSKRWLFETYGHFLDKQPSYASYFGKLHHAKVIKDIQSRGINTFVIWDDATYSGSDAKSRFIDIINKAYVGKSTKPKIIVAYSYYSDPAKKSILEKANVTFIGLNKMKTMSEVLTPEQSAFLAARDSLLSDGTEVLTAISTELMPHKIPDVHSFVAGARLIEKGVLSGTPIYKTATTKYAQTEAAQFTDYFSSDTKNLLETPITTQSLPQSLVERTTPVLTNECLGGCTYPVQTSTIVNDSTLAAQGKIAEGVAVDMSKVESVKFEITGDFIDAFPDETVVRKEGLDNLLNSGDGIMTASLKNRLDLENAFGPIENGVVVFEKIYFGDDTIMIPDWFIEKGVRWSRGDEFLNGSWVKGNLQYERKATGFGEIMSLEIDGEEIITTTVSGLKPELTVADISQPKQRVYAYPESQPVSVDEKYTQWSVLGMHSHPHTLSIPSQEDLGHVGGTMVRTVPTKIIFGRSTTSSAEIDSFTLFKVVDNVDYIQTYKINPETFKVIQVGELTVNTPSNTRITLTELDFTCASPCVWDNGSAVKVFDSYSAIDIKGDFSFMGKTSVVEYSKPLVINEGIAQALNGAPNLGVNEITQIELAMQEGKVVATIQPMLSGSQEVIVYAPKQVTQPTTTIVSTAEETATKLAYGQDSFLFEDQYLPVKGASVKQEQFIERIVIQFDRNPYLLETFNGAEVFHGSQSETLHYLVEHNGLKSFGELESKGFIPFSGTNDLGSAAGINQHSLSTTAISNYQGAADYAGSEETKITLEKLQTTLENLNATLLTLENKNSIGYIITTHNIDLTKARIQRFNLMTTEEQRIISDQYPVLFGIKSKRPNSYKMANTDIYHEIGLVSGANLDEIVVVYVPEHRISQVQNLLTSNSKTAHITVANLETLTGEKIIPIQPSINTPNYTLSKVQRAKDLVNAQNIGDIRAGLINVGNVAFGITAQKTKADLISEAINKFGEHFENGELIIATSENGEVIGYSFYDALLNKGDLYEVVVHNEAFGQGIGTQLVDATIDDFKRRGIEVVELTATTQEDVGVGDTYSIGFWEKYFKQRQINTGLNYTQEGKQFTFYPLTEN